MHVRLARRPVIWIRTIASASLAFVLAGCATGKLKDVSQLFRLPEGGETTMPTGTGALCRVHAVRVVDRTHYEVDRRLGNIVKESRRDGWIHYVTAEYTELPDHEPGEQAGVWTYSRYKVKVE